MLKANERRQKILEILCVRRQETMENLAQEFNVTIRTIRNDIEELTLAHPIETVSAIIPKSDKETIKKIQAAVEAAKQESLSKWGGKIPPNLKLPLRDGDIDRPEDEAYKGCYFFNANSRQAPQVVDKQVQPILDQTEVYSGCYGRISVNFYGYNSNGNRGVAAGLGNIQKLKDGEALSSRTNAEDDFEAVEDEDFLG